MSVFLPIPESEQQSISELLTGVFKSEPQTVSFRRDVLRWKYFSPHPQWEGPRSYAVKHGDSLVAHGGVWPLCLRNQGKSVSAIHLIDWAATKGAPGAGILLVRKFAQMADILLTIGGSSDTRAILPKLGYKHANNLRYFARVVRPWRQFRTSPNRNWKAPLRLARNTLWSFGSQRVPQSWDAVQISKFDDSHQSVLANSSGNVLRPWRTPSSLNYMLSCPAAKFSAFLILEHQKPRGYFMLARLSRQTRIIEIRLDTDNKQSWLAACRLATHVAAQDPLTCEIVAASSQEALASIFTEIGFRFRRSDPIYCYDPHELLADFSGLGLSMLDGDACFLSDPDHPYLT
jgi:hypothetical protein